MENPTAAEIPSVLRSTRFEVTDEHGIVRAVLGRLPDPDETAPPVFGLSLLDAEGRGRVWLALWPDGPKLEFTQGGNAAIELGVADPVLDVVRPGAFCHLNDGTGTSRLSWRVAPDGSLTLSVTVAGR